MTNPLTQTQKFTNSHYNRAIIHEKLGHYHQAITNYNKAIELDPTFAVAYYNRGITHEHLGDFEWAIKDFEKYLELSPDAFERESLLASIEELKQKLSLSD